MKARKISSKYQFIDMKEKGMSKGEFTSVAQANGGIENMINQDCKDKDTLVLLSILLRKIGWRSGTRVMNLFVDELKPVLRVEFFSVIMLVPKCLK